MLLHVHVCQWLLQPDLLRCDRSRCRRRPDHLTVLPQPGVEIELRDEPFPLLRLRALHHGFLPHLHAHYSAPAVDSSDRSILGCYRLAGCLPRRLYRRADPLIYKYGARMASLQTALRHFTARTGWPGSLLCGILACLNCLSHIFPTACALANSIINLSVEN